MLLADNSEITIPRVPLHIGPLWLLAAWIPKDHPDHSHMGQNRGSTLRAVPLRDTAGQCLLAPGQTSRAHRGETQGLGRGGEWPAPSLALRARHSQREAPDCAPGKLSLDKLQGNCENHLAP